MNQRVSVLGPCIAFFALSVASGCAGSNKSAESSADASEPAGGDMMSDSSSDDSDDAWGDDSEGTAPDASSDSGNPSGANEDELDSRTTETMAQVVKDNRHLFRLCYEKVEKQNPGIKGDIVITFTVSPEGRVTKAEMNQEQSTLKNEEVGKCAADEMKKLTFSKSSRGMESTMNYPFNFNPR